MHDLVAGSEITTIVNQTGPKDMKAHIRYCFDAAVSTRARQPSAAATTSPPDPAGSAA